MNTVTQCRDTSKEDHRPPVSHRSLLRCWDTIAPASRALVIEGLHVGRDHVYVPVEYSIFVPVERWPFF